jgi:hypothetical protein
LNKQEIPDRLTQQPATFCGLAENVSQSRSPTLTRNPE